MTGHLAQREEDADGTAPRRVSKADGVTDNGSTVTVHLQGKSYELNDKQLDEVADRLKKTRVGGIAADQLRTLVERIERMEEEKAGIASDIKDIFAEAKGNGYDVKTLRKVIKLRAMDAAERDEADHLLDTYARALGMRPQLELFEDEN